MLNVNETHVPVENWFTPKECNQIINYAVNNGNRNVPRVGYGQGAANRDKSIRDGDLFFFSNKDVSKKILSRVKKLNRDLWNLDCSILEPMQLTVYNVDDHYIWHRDQEKAGRVNPLHGEKNLIRKLSFSINLTQEGRDYRGGDVEFNDGYHVFSPPVLKQQGNGVLFLSALPHRVLPVTQGRRVALVGWVSGPPYR